MHLPAAADASTSSSSSSSSSELSCRHFRDCSGCSLSDDLSTPPVLREASARFRSVGVEIDTAERAANAHGWRCRARLAVRQGEGGEGGNHRAAAVDIGLFRSGTHSVSAIPDCVAHHPRINEAVEAIRSAVERLGTRVYSEGKHARGGLRYLQLTAVSGDESEKATKTPTHEDARARIQLVLVWGSDGSRQPAARGEAERLARLLWEEQKEEERNEAAASPASAPPPPLLHSIFLNWQPSPGNAVMGPTYERFAGPELAWQRIAVETGGGKREGSDSCSAAASSTSTSTSVAVALSPAAFSQANPSAFGSLVGELARVWSVGGPEEEDRGIVALADLHAGAGAVGLSLAAAAAALPATSKTSLSSSPPPPLAALERVVAVDCVGAGREPLAASAERLNSGNGGEEEEKKKKISVEFFEARAGEDPARWLASADAAVVDPPRKGLALGDPELLRVLCESPPRGLRRFAYISCHFPSLRRDAEELLQLPSSSEGGKQRSDSGETRNKRPLWRLSHGAARVFFPGADHVECLAVFERID